MSGPVDPPADGSHNEPSTTGSTPPPPPPPPGEGQYEQQYQGQQYGEQQYGNQPYGQQQYGQQQYGGPPPKQGNGAAVTGLVLGILGAIFAFIPFLGVLLGILLGLAAVIFAVVGLGKSKDPYRGGRGMSIAGIVLGIIAIGLSLLQGFVLGAAGNALINENPEVFEDIQEQIEQDLQTS